MGDQNSICSQAKETWSSHPRRTSPSYDSRRLHPTHRPLLVCLDEQPAYHLGPSGPGWYPDRLGNLDDFLAGVELHHRCLHVACELCHRCQYILEISCGRWIPVVRDSYVPQLGRQLGNVVTGISLHCYDSCANPVLHLWK